jgi:hypothetical protein
LPELFLDVGDYVADTETVGQVTLETALTSCIAKSSSRAVRARGFSFCNAVGMGVLLEQGKQFSARNDLRKARIVVTFRYEVSPAFPAVEQDDVAAITGQVYCRRQSCWPAADNQTVDIVRLHRKKRLAMFGKKSGSARAA